MATRCSNKFVNIIGATVPYYDVYTSVIVAVSAVTETDSFTGSAISHTGMSISQPAGRVSTTPVIRRTWSRQPGSRSSFKTIPPFSDAPVTKPAPGFVGYLPVCGIKALVVLTFWETKLSKRRWKSTFRGGESVKSVKSTIKRSSTIE